MQPSPAANRKPTRSREAPGRQSAQPSATGPPAALRRSFDYIVVGSGAGGAPVAANLARAGYRVLLLEAGGDAQENVDTQVPIFHGRSTEDPEIRWDYWVQHFSDEERQQADFKYHPQKYEENQPYYRDDETRRGILYPRCSALGGCTVHNAMILVHPHNSDWDRLAERLSDPSWRAERMRGYYQRLENCQYGVRNQFNGLLAGLLDVLCIPWNPGRRGYSGWLAVSRPNPTLLLQDKRLVKLIAKAVKQSFREGVGNPLLRLLRGLDPNSWAELEDRAEGVTLTPLTIHKNNGHRGSPVDLLKQVQAELPDRLIIRTNALVCRVLFDSSRRACGVEYVVGAQLYRAHAKSTAARHQIPDLPRRREYVTREVILAAGAFNTPQLLMLSGIGPEDQLEKAGYRSGTENPPVQILPGVGKNLQDRYEVSVVSDTTGDFPIVRDAPLEADDTDPYFRQWQRHGTGLYSTNGSVISFVKRSRPGRADPDLYVFGVVGDFQGYEPGYAEKAILQRDRFSWVILKGHTRGKRGEVTLRSPHFWDTPVINFRSFDDDPDSPESAWREDLESLVEGVQFARRINRQPAIAKMLDAEVAPGPAVTGDRLREYIKSHAWGHHCSCTCPMGPADDPGAVLDSDFRVRGVSHLRVVDASVFPTIPGLFIVSAIYMIAEKASDRILADAQRSELVQGALQEPPDVERIPDDEEATIQRIIGLLRHKLASDYRRTTSLRDTHPKSNGLVRAQFIVEPTLLDRYRVGLFRQPRTFDALVRFSNAAPEVTPDEAPDFRGIAIKLLGVQEREFGPRLLDDERNTHDFLMIAHNAFFAANPKDFAEFFDALINGPFTRWFGMRGRRADVLTQYILAGGRFRQGWNLLRGRGRFGNPLEIRWFGISPYRFGPDRVVKYSVRPASSLRTPLPRRPTQNYLRGRMTEILARQDYDLDFMIQERTHPDKMPLENTAIPWSEQLSPFVKIATLRIVRQDFNDPAHIAFDENLSFNPWHCLAEHQPLGGINRARRPVMKALSDFRLERNGVARSEPTIDALLKTERDPQ